jgi:hypothetical protein
MIDVPIDEHYTGDGCVANRATRLHLRKGLELLTYIRRRIEENPAFTIGTYCDRGLGS